MTNKHTLLTEDILEQFRALATDPTITQYPSLAETINLLLNHIDAQAKEIDELKEKFDVAMEYLNELKDEYACSWRIGINVNHEVFKND